MASELYLLDTNILIRWVQRETAEFAMVTAGVRQIMAGHEVRCYTSQNLGEFWNVLTRPADRHGYGLTPELADRRAIDIESAFRLLPDNLNVHAEWRKLLVDHRISGTQVHDAPFAASMYSHDVKRILTFNARDFARFHRIEAVHPRDIVGSA